MENRRDQTTLRTSGIHLVAEAKATIGESPLWCPRQNVLYWVDIKAPALFRTAPDGSRTGIWRLPSDIGGYALAASGSGAVVALRTGLFALDFADGALAKLHDAPFDPRLHRFNEGDCDAGGRLWLGTMFDPQPGVDATPVKGHLYSYRSDEGLVRRDFDAELHNGFAWSPDGETMYIAHSDEGRIYACAFDAAAGTLGEKRVFAEIGKELGIPDGGAVDAEGGYWSAIHGGGCLHRYMPDGRLERVVELPVEHPTMMAFGGTDLRDLYVTSATQGEAGPPHEGALLRLRPGVAGLKRRTIVA